MPSPPPPSRALLAHLDAIEDFEASESVANTGAGTRRDGEGFEHLISRMWQTLVEDAGQAGAMLSLTRHPRGKAYAKLAVERRALYLPLELPEDTPPPAEHPQPEWLETLFEVSHMVDFFPGREQAVQRYAADDGEFGGEAYLEMFGGLSTKFDDTIALEDDGELVEKILLEYKTAKSSEGRQIDGNAHERLTFQMMQYLEIAARLKRCSLVVLANGAFLRYRNKYHVNFQIQAERLTIFPWFDMRYHCTKSGMHLFLTSLMQWLFDGTPRKATASR
jgi:hypothetical protein